MASALDHQYMLHAIRIAERVRGRTAPNPGVGCVIVKDEQVVGYAHSGVGGRPHAEPQAIEMAGEAARGATLYCTLEPCCHTGQTPPCTDAIIQAGIARVVIGCVDRDERVAAQGIAALRAARIEVETGIAEEACQRLHASFFTRITDYRPEVTLKIATTLDGNIALANGASQWITGEQARRFGHMLRARHDAIATGIGTAMQDNPALNCRLPGMQSHSPTRIVFDSMLRIGEQQALVSDDPAHTWIITRAAHRDEHAERCERLEACGIRLLFADERDGKIDLADALRLLAKEGINSLLLEAGQVLSTAFLRAELIDTLYWFRAPSLIGSDGMPGFGAMRYESLAQIARFQRRDTLALGSDICEVYQKA